MFTSAYADTYVLAEFGFDGPNSPDPQGWFGVDLTAQEGAFFHVDDFAGLGGGNSGNLVPIEGSKSLWCGMSPSGDPRFCGYTTPPGYGNSWDQRFESRSFTCTGDVTLGFKAFYDSEPGYDYTYVQYLSKTGNWRALLTLNGTGTTAPALTIPADSLAGLVKLRFLFISDGAWSDKDGLYDSDGGIVVDSLVVSDTGGLIDYQDFESEAVGDTVTSDGDWRARVNPGYGDFTGLFPGFSVLQEDLCRKNATWLWGFFNGSTYDYTCGGHPEQKVVPYGEERDGIMKYLTNEVWSPLIDWNHDINGNPVPSTASAAYFEFDIYEDNPLNPLVFFIWHIRSWIGGCPGQWRDRAFVDYGYSKTWVRRRDFYADLVQPGAEQIQLALGCYDLCEFWCGYYGTGECHTHAPLYDNVRFIRIDIKGPQWYVQDRYLFQDNFASDGTVTGTVRMDMATDRLSTFNPNVRPGDSTVVTVSEPNYGLDNHITGDPSSGPAVYIHVRELGPSKSGAAVSGDISRWPVVSSGGGWTVLRMDTVFSKPGRRFVVPDVYCADLNDNLYTPGDTIEFYFSARDAAGNVSYAYGPTTSYSADFPNVTLTEAEAQADPMEVTCLPANALAGTTDVLYVDACSGYGAQPYFGSSFELLGITPDRYDVRAPSSVLGNGPGSRVVSTANQIIPYYKKIIWNSGSLSSGTMGDGGNSKSNDFGMLYSFLDQHPGGPGLYISGDEIAAEWAILTGADAINLKNDYMNFNVLSSSHTTMGLPLSPLAIGQAGSCFVHASSPDSIVAYSNYCTWAGNFDVLEATGSSGTAMAYENNPAYGALLAQTTTNGVGASAKVMLSGLSYHDIRDDRVAFPPDRAEHLLDILRWMDNVINDPTGGGDLRFETGLAQNYPNPFNPTTTIKYSIRERAHVSLKIYNVSGQLVRTLENSVKEADVYKKVWDGRNDRGEAVSSGVYFYRLITKDFAKTRKMVLLR
jgi:hypothetical protein